MTEPVDGRDEVIIERYKNEDITLEELGSPYGLSGARIGQILKSAGIDARKIQKDRTQMRAERRTQSIRTLAEDIRGAVTALAADGLSRAAIEAHIRVFRPRIRSEDISAAVDYLRSTGVVIDKSRKDRRVSDALLRSSLLYVLGLRLELTEPKIPAEEGLDPEIVSDTAEVLAKGGLNPEEIIRTLGIIQAASERLEEDPSVTLPGAVYDAKRLEFIALHPSMGKEIVSWPVGSLTVSKRLGGSWNAALSSLGIATQEAPQGFGAAQYSPEEYAEAVRNFVAAGVGNTYGDYEAWVQSEQQEGRSRPSGPSVRNIYGSWNLALRSGGDPSMVDRVTERRGRVSAETAIGDLVRQKEEEYDELQTRLESLAESGELTPEMLASIEQQKALTTATLRRYEQEEERWKAQESRWAEQDIHGARQFRINLWLAIGVGASSAVAPLFVWVLDFFLGRS